MKKYLFGLIVLLSSSVASYAVGPDSTKQELTKEVIYNDAKEALSQLGAALKVGAEHVYEVLVRQQVVESITYLVVGLVSVIFLIICYKQANKVQFDNYNNITKGGINMTYAVCFGVVGVITGLFALFNIQTIVTGFVNPEYGAIKTILDTIKH